MSNPEQAVRDAALVLHDAAMALHDAIMAARAAGLYVQWPNRPEHLPGIAISETKKARQIMIDGQAVAPGELRGEPLNITEEERAALTPLDPDASNDPAGFTVGEMASGKGRRSKP